ncbi:MAG: hypothetical protein GF331_26775 [Chitinivibrionales bacterium]|nr:hypothetical protein [Chitinivibrionales bacterium]
MLFEHIDYNGTLLLRFTESISPTTSIQALHDTVRSALRGGRLHFAIVFTPDTFLYSHHVAVVIKCIERIRESGGTLTIVRPNNDIADMLSFVDPDGFTGRVQEEADLPVVQRVGNPA